MNEAQVRQIISQQKSLGRSPEELLGLASGAGITQAQVMPVLLDLFPGFRHGGNTKPVAQPEDTSLKIWDPAEQHITETRFEEVNQKIQKKFEFYKQHPKRIKRNAALFVLLGLIGNGLMAALFYFNPDLFWAIILGGGGDDEGFPAVLAIPWAPLAWYVFRIHKLQRDLVKKIIADKRDWVYNPEPRKVAWLELKKKFPKIFDKGTGSQELEDEFWGKFHTASQERDFYSGIFHYAITRGHGKNKKTTHYYQTIFAIRLEKVLKNALLLVPEKKSDRFWRSLGIGSDVNVESAAFNEAFKVFKNGEPNQEEMLSIFQKLTPAVQEQLVDLSKQHKDSSIYFAGDTFLFSRKGMLFPSKKGLTLNKHSVKMHTNFFKKVELDPRDEEYLQERFDTLLSIASNVAKYLD